jgi:uncharacterized protein (TIGR02594 family)
MRATKTTARTKNKVCKSKTPKRPVRTKRVNRMPAAGVSPAEQAVLDAARRSRTNPAVIASCAQPQPRYARYNAALLAAGIGTLTLLAVPVIYFGGSNVADAVPHRSEIAVEALIDAQVAPGRIDLSNLPLVANLTVARKPASAPESNGGMTQREANLAPAVRHTETQTNSVAVATETNSAPAATRSTGPAARHAAAAVPTPADAAAAAYASANRLIAEARRYLGTNPTGRATLWCGAFLDMVLRKTGHRGGGNLALNYAHYGTRLPSPQVGAIVVLRRTGGGHVGIVTGVDANGNPIVISGNHSRRVAEAVYPRSRVIAYVSPDGGG